MIWIHTIYKLELFSEFTYQKYQQITFGQKYLIWNVSKSKIISGSQVEKLFVNNFQVKNLEFCTHDFLFGTFSDRCLSFEL